MVTLALAIAIVFILGILYARAAEYPIFPPAQYDHDYEGDLTIKMVDSIDELKVLCDVPNAPHMLACSMQNDRSCLIIMVEVARPPSQRISDKKLNGINETMRRNVESAESPIYQSGLRKP